MSLTYQTEMPTMIILENRVMKREVQLKLVMIHFTKLQVTMRRELFLLNLSQRKNQATKMRRTMN
jgi:hypothetical protein